ncbi:unnamed protein product [Mesocestoides corti]|uniref:Transposase n=1 Tax=Mesocestoides corti TaxID=53468 RepID=A0A0R3UCX0_MESCO|nr:unnamed protein product [Mesocestoides corti]
MGIIAIHHNLIFIADNNLTQLTAGKEASGRGDGWASYTPSTNQRQPTTATQPAEHTLIAVARYRFATL